MIRNLEEYYDNDLLLEVKGILNGSSNYILSRVFDHADLRQRPGAGAGAGLRRKRPVVRHRGLRFALQAGDHHRACAGNLRRPGEIFTYGISTIHDSDIQYAREKNVKIKLVAQVVKVSDEHFTMFVMPEFVTPSEVYLQRRRRVQRRGDPRRVLRPAVHVRQGRGACPRPRPS